MRSTFKSIVLGSFLIGLMTIAPAAEALVGNIASPTAIDPTNQANANFSGGVATGDFNNDGYADVIAAADLYNAEASNEGRAYVYMGSASGLSSTPALTLDPTDQVDAQFGLLMSSGDINGDDYDDVVIGASGYGVEYGLEGRAYVYMGSASGLSSTPALTLDPTDQAGAGFGLHSAIGDINNDGFFDAIITAPFYDGYVGRAYVYMGSASGLSGTPALELHPTAVAGSVFGVSLSSDDIDGDGFSDLLISAIGYGEGGYSSEGRVYVYMGSASGLSGTPALTLDPTDQVDANLAMVALGDINGDGFSDALMGSLTYDAQVADEGRVYVYMGSASGLSGTPALTLDPTDRINANFGYGMASADINGDGFSDAIIGAPNAWYGVFNSAGDAYVYMGSASGLSSTPALVLEPVGAVGDAFSSEISTGDIDGDGYHDMVISAYGYDAEAANEGRAYVYYGSPDNLVYQDTDHDGQVDNIRWTMDETVTACPYVAGNWSVATAGTIGVTAITGLTCAGDDNILDIAVTSGADKTGGVTNPAITYNYLAGDHITVTSGNLGTFTARAATDAANPVILSVSPAASATSVALTTPIVVTFSEAMNGPGTACTFTSSPNPGGFDLITAGANWSNGDKTVTLAHASSYTRSTLVTITIGGCTDASTGHIALATNPDVANPSTFTTIGGIGGGGGGGGTVTPASVTLSIPNGGGSYNAGQQIGITWTSANGAFVNYRVSYSSDNGNAWNVLDTTSNPSYTWTVPTASTTQGLIKVEGLDSTGAVLATDVSDTVFTVVGTTAPPPPVTPPATPPPATDSNVSGAYDALTAKSNTPDINTDKQLPAAPPFTAWCVSGTLIKTESSPAVYYCGADGKRYVFVNDKAYFSWYPDFSTVQVISEQTMAEIPIGGNITYRPGSRMVKIQSDPKVYAVARGGILRWVASEAVAVRLYGAAWNTMIDDVPDSFFVNYTLGEPITE